MSHLYIKTNVLPRQARDKHTKTQKRDRFSPALGEDGNAPCSFCSNFRVSKFFVYQDRLGTNRRRVGQKRSGRLSLQGRWLEAREIFGAQSTVRSKTHNLISDAPFSIQATENVHSICQARLGTNVLKKETRRTESVVFVRAATPMNDTSVLLEYFKRKAAVRNTHATFCAISI